MELFPPFTESVSPKLPPFPASKPKSDNLPQCRPPGAPNHHIYQQYFTSAERRRLKSISENDVSSEIQLLRILLARCFAQVPRFPHDSKKPALPMKLHIDLVTVFSRVAIVIGEMVGLQNKMHKNEIGDIILQALRELDPHKDFC